MITDTQGGKIRANHAYIVDLGTGERTRADGNSAGKMPALKYWTDTRNEDMDKAIDAVLDGTEKAIIKIMTEMSKKQIIYY